MALAVPTHVVEATVSGVAHIAMAESDLLYFSCTADTPQPRASWTHFDTSEGGTLT